MTDKLFQKIEYHRDNLKKNHKHLTYCSKAFNKKVGLDDLVENTSEIKKEELKKYSCFKYIKLEDILFLRANIDVHNAEHRLWCNKIYRFLEFRLSSIQKRLKKNYDKKVDRINLIQNVITLMLEYYEITKDNRFLSISLKLLRNNSISKYGFLNNSISVHFSYNILVVHNLTKKL